MRHRGHFPALFHATCKKRAPGADLFHPRMGCTPGQVASRGSPAASRRVRTGASRADACQGGRSARAWSQMGPEGGLGGHAGCGRPYTVRGLGEGGAERRRAVGCAAGPRPGRHFTRKVKLPRHYIPSLWWFFLIVGRPGRTGRLAGTRRVSPGFGLRGVGQRARRGLHLAGIDRKGVPVPWVLGARAGGGRRPAWL